MHDAPIFTADDLRAAGERLHRFGARACGELLVEIGAIAPFETAQKINEAVDAYTQATDMLEQCNIVPLPITPTLRMIEGGKHDD